MIQNVASMNAHQNWLDNSATNVANAANRQSGSLESTVSSGANGSPQLQTRASEQAPDIAKEMTDQVMIPDAAEANADAIRTQNEMTGSILNILA